MVLVFTISACPAHAQSGRAGNAAPAALHIQVNVVPVLIPPANSFNVSGSVLLLLDGRGMDEISEFRQVSAGKDFGPNRARIEDCARGCIVKTRTIVAR